ncbi:MAG TPA: response regulator [Longimicrobiales bacterium]|nr:response regulator [Longimicrobiales bacterium]
MGDSFSRAAKLGIRTVFPTVALVGGAAQAAAAAVLDPRVAAPGPLRLALPLAAAAVAGMVLPPLLRRGGRLAAALRRRRGESAFRELVDAAPDAVLVCVEERVAYGNRAAHALLGAAERGALEGVPLVELLHPDDREAMLEGLRRLLAEDVRFELAERRFVRSDGELVHVELTAAPARFGGAVAVQLVGRAVMDRRRLESRLRKAQRLEAAGRLSEAVAQELDGVLGEIACSASLALDELAFGHPARGDLDEIRDAVERAGGLTRRLLALKPEPEVHPRVVDVNGLVQALTRRLRRTLGPGVALRVIPDARAGAAEADAAHLEQLVLDVAAFARDGIPAGASFTVATARAQLAAPRPHATGVVPAGEYVTLTARVPGGVDAAAVERLLDPGHVPDAAGPALGLTSISGALRHAGAHIAVEHGAGGETGVTVYLPVAEPLAAVRDDDADDPHSTILVVDDEEAVRRVAARALSRAGHRVIAAEHGVAALLLLADQANPPDLVLTDVVMPEMGGRELGDALAHRYPHLPVLYMSGFTADELFRKGLVDGSHRLVHKPFSIGGLVEAVEEALKAS